MKEIAYSRASDLDGAGRFFLLRPGDDMTVAQVGPSGLGIVRMPIATGDEITAIAEVNDELYAAYSIDGGSGLPSSARRVFSSGRIFSGR